MGRSVILVPTARRVWVAQVRTNMPAAFWPKAEGGAPFSGDAALLAKLAEAILSLEVKPRRPGPLPLPRQPTCKNSRHRSQMNG